MYLTVIRISCGVVGRLPVAREQGWRAAEDAANPGDRSFGAACDPDLVSCQSRLGDSPPGFPVARLRACSFSARSAERLHLIRAS